MTKIAVFDSGLGSLSIINSIKKKIKCEIIYFADQYNFPYGEKSKKELDDIIKKSISFLKKNYLPDIIIMGSNTPSLLLDTIDSQIIKVLPPLIRASKLTKTNNIAILATKSSVNSIGLKNYIKNCTLPKKIKIHKKDVSILIELVESGKFLTDKNFCENIIEKQLEKYLIVKKIDVVTLSSTHLSFLKSFLEKKFPFITFLDPSDSIVDKIIKEKKIKSDNRNYIKIITTGNINKLQKILLKYGIKKPILKISPI